MLIKEHTLLSMKIKFQNTFFINIKLKILLISLVVLFYLFCFCFIYLSPIIFETASA